MPKNICVAVALQSAWCNYRKCFATSFHAQPNSSYISVFIFTEYCLPNSLPLHSQEKHTKATSRKKATMSNGTKKKKPNKKFTKWAEFMKWNGFSEKHYNALSQFATLLVYLLYGCFIYFLSDNGHWFYGDMAATIAIAAKCDNLFDSKILN